LQTIPLPVEEFLQIALGICDALIPLQRAEGCYGQLSPDTICIGSAPLEIGLASADAREIPSEPAARTLVASGAKTINGHTAPSWFTKDRRSTLSAPRRSLT
jgi:hypothetical protein